MQLIKILTNKQKKLFEFERTDLIGKLGISGCLKHFKIKNTILVSFVWRMIFSATTATTIRHKKKMSRAIRLTDNNDLWFERNFCWLLITASSTIDIDRVYCVLITCGFHNKHIELINISYFFSYFFD